MLVRSTLVTAFLLLFGPGVPAQDRTADPGVDEAELQRRIDLQVERYEEAFGRWAMQTRIRPDAPHEASRPRVKDFAAPIWEVVQAHPGTAVARGALLWLHTRLDRSEQKDRARALDLILAHHLAHESMTELCMRLSYEDGAQVLAALHAFLDRSPHLSVRGLACYGLGRVLARDPKAHSEAEALLERARTEFGEVTWGIEGLVAATKLSSKAVADLYELRNLQVGMRAPEIEGEDVDGVRFKLSDYAGKVVLLDFWGFW